MPAMTVLGEVDDSELGVVLPHEHLIADATAQWADPDDLDELAESLRPISPEVRGRSQLEPFFFRSVLQLQDPRVAVEELQAFIDLGGRTVVDLTNVGFGRNPRALKAIALVTGLNVVMGCGEYVESTHSSYVASASEEQIADVMIRDLTKGVGSSGIRAGIIGEIGSGNPVNEAEEKVLRAAARAQRTTGVALNIHRTVYPESSAGLRALDVVLKEGVDPGKVVMSHCDERPEKEFALEVGRRGAIIECDTFGMEQWAANWMQKGRQVKRSFDQDRIDLVKAVVDAGYLDQLLISQDVCFQTQLVRNGGWGYAHISRNIEARLEAAGLRSAEIERIRIENPKRILCYQRTS